VFNVIIRYYADMLMDALFVKQPYRNFGVASQAKYKSATEAQKRSSAGTLVLNRNLLHISQ